MTEIEKFIQERKQNIEAQGTNVNLKATAGAFMNASITSRYSYNFSWMGRPIIQYPQDIMAMQELIWEIKPDIIVETGIAHGGSLIFYASMLELNGKGEVVGIDIDIREHNRREIEKHPMFKRITLIQGSAIDPEVVNQVKAYIDGKKTVMVVLDSNHTHDHVLAELNMYSPLVTVNSYLIVYDTIVEMLAPDLLPGNVRPWSVGNNPWTAVKAFVETNDKFIIDKSIDNKLQISVGPDGYLKRIK